MNQPDNEAAIQKNKAIIWDRINALDSKPTYPAIVQQVLITATEEEYYDRDLDYNEKYTEWLELRQGSLRRHRACGQSCGLGQAGWRGGDSERAQGSKNH